MHNGEKSVQAKDRLIEAAGEMFSLRGYRAATVREICRKARTHVGAVNYHFRDKEGLFTAVLEHAHQWSVRKYPPDAGLSGEASPEEKLRVFVSSFLLRVLGQGAPDWHGRLMIREMSEPSKALNRMVRSSIHPLYQYLVSILRELLSEDRSATDEVNETAFLCAMSITGQCLQYFTGRHVIATLCPAGFDSTDLERLTDHIVQFSLGGIRELKARV